MSDELRFPYSSMLSRSHLQVQLRPYVSGANPGPGGGARAPDVRARGGGGAIAPEVSGRRKVFAIRIKSLTGTAHAQGAWAGREGLYGDRTLQNSAGNRLVPPSEQNPGGCRGGLAFVRSPFSAPFAFTLRCLRRRRRRRCRVPRRRRAAVNLDAGVVNMSSRKSSSRVCRASRKKAPMIPYINQFLPEYGR